MKGEFLLALPTFLHRCGTSSGCGIIFELYNPKIYGIILNCII